jgi:photosystem II stability/assembly factor-like uncharacterized protein
MRRRHRAFVGLCLSASLALAAMQPAAALSVPSRWFWQNPLPQGNDLLDMAFTPDGVRGWAVGYGGALLRTDCEGAQWVEHPTPPSSDTVFSCVAAPAPDTVVVAGTQLYRSVDGGATWSASPCGGSPQIVRFRSASLGWVATDSGELLRTDDGGAVWSVATTPWRFADALAMYDTGAGLLVSVCDLARTRLETWYSSDEGRTWRTVASHAYGIAAFHDFAFGSATSGVAIDSQFRAYRTTDGGQTWAGPVNCRGFAGWTPTGPDVALDRSIAAWMVGARAGRCLSELGYGTQTVDGGLTWRWYDVVFLDRYGNPGPRPTGLRGVVSAGPRLLAFGSGGYIAFSNDGGLTFQNVTAEHADSIVDASFESSSTGTAVTSTGFLVTQDGGATWARTPAAADESILAVSMAGGVGWCVGQAYVPGGDNPWRLVIDRVERAGSSLRRIRQQVVAPAETTMTVLRSVWTNDGIAAWAAGPTYGSPVVFKTIDGGANWTAVRLPELSPRDGTYRPQIQILPSGVGWLGGEAYMARTSDGGASWTRVSSCPLSARSIFVQDDSTCFVGGKGAIAVTRDAGASWTAVRAFPIGPDAPEVADITFSDPLNGYAVAGGRVIVTSDGGASWTTAEPAGPIFRAIAASEGGVWALGYGGAVLYNGGALGDYVPPITRTSISDRWYQTDTSVYLVPSDQCGVDGTWWTVSRDDTAPPAFGGGVSPASLSLAATGDAASPYRRYTGPIRVSAEGVTRVAFFSRDTSGNVETPRVVSVRVDKSPPKVNLSASRRFRRKRGLVISAVDAGSGVRSITYRWDRGRYRTVAAASVRVTARLGRRKLTYWATDNLGRRSKARTVRLSVVR